MDFDANNHATTSGDLTIYNYSQVCGILINRETYHIIAGFGLPANSTALIPPEAPAGQVAVFRNNEWQLVEDHQDATVWDKADGSRAAVSAPGPIPDTLTAVEPTGPFVVWDNAKNGWAFNQALRDGQMKTQASAALQQARQSVYNNYGILGEPTPADWITYLKALMAIENGTDTTSTALPTAPAQ